VPGGLERPRVRVRVGGTVAETALSGSGTTTLGGLEVDVAEVDEAGPRGWTWTVANPGDTPLAVEAVAVVGDVGAVGPEPRLFRHGYQSWSPSAVARLGVDDDPSRTEGSRWLSRAAHAADPVVTEPGELRSELVTVLDRGGGAALLGAGFEGGTTHDGTFRVRLVGGRVELAAEAYLGGALLAPGEARPLHGVGIEEGEPDTAPELLERWAARVGAAGGARTTAPYQVGWCSWYQYFAAVSERDVLATLALAGDWPFDVVQVDDGYQSAVGDWLSTNERFGPDLSALAAAVHDAGRAPGIWVAPFLAAPSSQVLAVHPDWVARHPSGRPLVGMVSPAWGGEVLVLDTTRPDVLAHLEATAADLVAAGFGYLKADFTYAPSLAGKYFDASRTPAQRVRAGMEALRRGVGETGFLLGCGLPLGAGVGVVDGMRIGADVAPWWALPDERAQLPGYADAEPATLNAWRNTLTRSFCHRRLWLNDPDCVLLRTEDTDLTADAARAWALAVGASGGMALLSDDLSLLGADARRLFDEVLELGRAADAGARRGPPPRCDDLLASPTPGRLSSAGVRLVGDPASATARIERHGG
jgi:alpha-galactosidase